MRISSQHGLFYAGFCYVKGKKGNKMSNWLLLVYPVAMLVVAFWNCKTYKKGEFSESAWDKTETKYIQGIACLFVVLHHLTQSITSYGHIHKGPITVLSSMGILFTAIFFFGSGYGLIVSVYSNPRYLKTFLSHRVPTILIPFWVANTICVLIRINYNHIPTTYENILRCCLGINLLNGNGWFIVEIFWLYLIFYLSFSLFSKKDIALVATILGTFYIIHKGFSNGHDYFSIGDRWFMGEWWYNSTVVFIMGMLFARFKSEIFSFVKRHYQIILTVTIIAFAIAFVCENIIRNRYGYYNENIIVDGVNSKLITFIAQSVVCLVFVFLILLVNMKVSIGNRVLKLLSAISMELFLIHGLFLKNIFDFTHVADFLIFLIVIVCGVIGAILLHIIDWLLFSVLGVYKKSSDNLGNSPEHQVDMWHRITAKHGKIIVLIAVSVLSVLVVGLIIFLIYIRPATEYKDEARLFSNAKAGDVVNFGRFDTVSYLPGKERLEWIVLYKEDDELLLIARQGLVGKEYNKEHCDIAWENSTLRKYLNEDFYNTVFGKKEKNLVCADSISGDKVTLLTIAEAEMLFADDLSRQISVTDVALKNGTNINKLSKVNYWDTKDYRSSWWWLRGEDGESIFAPIVSVDGEILENEKYVNKPGGAVRPVIRVKKSEK